MHYTFYWILAGLCFIGMSFFVSMAWKQQQVHWQAREAQGRSEEFLPRLSYGLLNLPSKYQLGLEVDGVVWQDDFREYVLRVENKHVNMELSDFRLDVDVPGGVVMARVYDQAGCDDLKIFTGDNVGHIVKRSTGVATRRFTSFSNNIKMSAVRLFPTSHFDIKLIVKLIPMGQPEGFWEVDYNHLDARGDSVHKNEKFRIVPLKGIAMKLTVGSKS